MHTDHVLIVSHSGWNQEFSMGKNWPIYYWPVAIYSNNTWVDRVDKYSSVWDPKSQGIIGKYAWESQQNDPIIEHSHQRAVGSSRCQ